MSHNHSSKTISTRIVHLLTGISLLSAISGATAALPTPVEELGRKLFFDKSLSNPPGQSCATCHAPTAGFADPDRAQPVSKGVIGTRFGFRNAPTVSYAAFIPPLHFDEEAGTYVGGLFLDGRATDLANQALFPFLNPIEMHNRSFHEVVDKVRKGTSAGLFRKVFGKNSLAPAKDEVAYVQITDAIAAFERRPEFRTFSSKFDYYLRGQARLSAQEARGLALFNGKANCFACHPSTSAPGQPGPMFTDFTYDNIGIPRDTNSPFLKLPPEFNPDGADFVDYGLANTVAAFDPTNAPAEAGKFRVSTLRNLSRTGPYGHNGFFKSIKQIVHFYNTRDLPEAGWPGAEVPETVNHDELGNLGLTESEENDLVVFLLTLTEGYRPLR